MHFEEREHQQVKNRRKKISVKNNKDLFRRTTIASNHMLQETVHSNISHSQNSKILRYPVNYEPNRYMFTQQDKLEQPLCGCLSLKELRDCQIYISSNQLVTRRQLMKQSGCYQCESN